MSWSLMQDRSRAVTGELIPITYCDRTIAWVYYFSHSDLERLRSFFSLSARPQFSGQ